VFLYLVQHGEAEREEIDRSRPLTLNGRDCVGKIARFAAMAQVRVDRIFHSGKLRALQTAEILGEALRPSVGIIETEDLAPLDDPLIWLERLGGMMEDCALVGHLPHLQQLAALLLCGTVEKKVVAFVMGGIVALERDDEGNWSVAWMVRPDLLRQ
jgi:phosphohistidine phosphatase